MEIPMSIFCWVCHLLSYYICTSRSSSQIPGAFHHGRFCHQGQIFPMYNVKNKMIVITFKNYTAITSAVPHMSSVTCAKHKKKWKGILLNLHAQSWEKWSRDQFGRGEGTRGNGTVSGTSTVPAWQYHHHPPVTSDSKPLTIDPVLLTIDPVPLTIAPTNHWSLLQATSWVKNHRCSQNEHSSVSNGPISWPVPAKWARGGQKGKETGFMARP